MKGFVFTLDVVIALLLVIAVMLSYSSLFKIEQSVSQTELKIAADSALLAMEETGLLGTAANGNNNSAQITAFLNSALPSNLNANVSIQRYQPKSDGSFDLKYTLNATTGIFAPPYSSARRVGIVVKKDRNEFAFAQITVGFK